MAFKPMTQTQQPKLTPTAEQLDIIEAAKTGTNLAIKAFAGAGKTSTFVLLAKELPKPSLYIAFNKSIADEATEKFPGNVECRTVHSLAYREIVDSKMRKKLQNFFNYSDLDTLPSWYKCGGLEGGFDLKLEVIEVIKKFCQSASTDLDQFISANYKALDLKASLGDISRLTHEFWFKLIDKTDPTKITPDIYLKLYQLSNPRLEYDVIYLDEAQDSNEVTLDIVLSQDAQIIIVGDPYQAIYEWRGAVNAFDKIPETFAEKYLSESFRFTQDIADKATSLLSIAGNEHKIIGRAEEKQLQLDSVDFAILARNNSTILEKLLGAVELNKKVYCLADLKSLWGKLYHINSLYFKEKPKYPDKELSEYRNYAELLLAAEKLPELKKLVNATITLSAGGLHKNIENIKSILVESKEEADFTISTIHKSKGLEWDKVIICDDVVPTRPEESDYEDFSYLLENQGLNIMYVALTRGKYEVQLPGEFVEILGEVG